MSKFKVRDYTHIVDFREYDPLSPIEAIKANCKQCYCWEVSEMKKCESYTCPFHQFLVRGFKSMRTYNLSDEERKRRSERLKKSKK